MDERKYCVIENVDHTRFGNFSQVSVQLNILQFNGSRLKYESLFENVYIRAWHFSVCFLYQSTFCSDSSLRRLSDSLS